MSQDNFIHKAWEFNPKLGNMDFKAAGFGTSGGFGSVGVSYFKSSINLQTHELMTPFGFQDGLSGPYPRFDPNVQVNLDRSDERDAAFLAGLEALQEVLIKVAYERRVEWNLFPSQRQADKATLEDVRAKFSPMVRPSKGDYPPTFKIAFMTKKDKTYATPCTGPDGESMMPNPNTIPRRSRVVMDIQARSVWISGDGKFGMKWKIQKLHVIEEGGSGGGGSAGWGKGGGELAFDDSDGEDDDVDSGEGGGKKKVHVTPLGPPKGGGGGGGGKSMGACLLKDDDEISE